jgi:antibiotic biosynthesis monooxygenase (ABM) superfamily enzyme
MWRVTPKPTVEDMNTAAPAPVRTPAPSVHERAFITWTAIFPLVVLAQLALAPFIDAWPPILRTLAMTLVVVPIAVYVVVPRLMAAYLRVIRPRR